jgi:hypothetical protein
MDQAAGGLVVAKAADVRDSAIGVRWRVSSTAKAFGY